LSNVKSPVFKIRVVLFSWSLEAVLLFNRTELSLSSFIFRKVSPATLWFPSAASGTFEGHGRTPGPGRQSVAMEPFHSSSRECQEPAIPQMSMSRRSSLPIAHGAHGEPAYALPAPSTLPMQRGLKADELYIYERLQLVLPSSTLPVRPGVARFPRISNSTFRHHPSVSLHPLLAINCEIVCLSERAEYCTELGCV
jgi:hypothetical protein